MTNTFVIVAIVVAVLFFICLPFIGKKVHKKYSVMKADRELRIARYNADRRIKNANPVVIRENVKVAHNAANASNRKHEAKLAIEENKSNGDRRIKNSNPAAIRQHVNVAHNAANIGTILNKTRNKTVNIGTIFKTRNKAASTIAKSYRNYSNRRKS